MKKLRTYILALISGSFLCNAQPVLDIKLVDGKYNLILNSGKSCSMFSPEEGLWSIATAWKNDWPADWQHSSPDKFQEIGDWKILSGTLNLPGGTWIFRDAYKNDNGMIKCIRRFEWTGKNSLDSVTLSVRWKVKRADLQVFLPGIIYYGNPSGEKNTRERVPFYHGLPGEMAIFEEHRYPMPFACLEAGKDDNKFGAALYTIPSP